jgi:hypothetical protein
MVGDPKTFAILLYGTDIVPILAIPLLVISFDT